MQQELNNMRERNKHKNVLRSWWIVDEVETLGGCCAGLIIGQCHLTKLRLMAPKRPKNNEHYDSQCMHHAQNAVI